MSDYLTVAQCAARFNVKPSSWRTMVARGYAPAPDDPGDLALPAKARSPRWLSSTLDAWRRPGRGRGPRMPRGRHVVPFSGELR